MRFRGLLAVLLLGVSFNSFARPADLAVSLTLPEPAQTGERDLRVNLVFYNTGEAPLTLTSWYLPDNEPEGDLFLVSRNGQPVPYLGAIYKRPLPTADDLVTLAPGESITRTVDLSDMYDFSESGVYAIQYGVASAHMFADTPVTEHAMRHGREITPEIGGSREVFSNEAFAYVVGRGKAAPVAALAARTSGTFAAVQEQSTIAYSGRCSATQQSTITSAVGAASTMANGSVSYLNGTPAATQRYTTWFGTYSSTNWNEVKGHFVSIKDALDTKPLVFDCACKKSYYAYVYPTQPYKVYLCRAFWNAPLTGTDSKGGTIIHELSHFNVIAGTDDYAYGQTAAKQLAISNPAQARYNADSHEYFAENTPALQ
jgi:peptidyl-Lys metalloendopeptidase